MEMDYCLSTDLVFQFFTMPAVNLHLFLGSLHFDVQAQICTTSSGLVLPKGFPIIDTNLLDRCSHIQHVRGVEPIKSGIATFSFPDATYGKEHLFRLPFVLSELPFFFLGLSTLNPYQLRIDYITRTGSLKLMSAKALVDNGTPVLERR